jgi:hypothetical protein
MTTQLILGEDLFETIRRAIKEAPDVVLIVVKTGEEYVLKVSCVPRAEMVSFDDDMNFFLSDIDPVTDKLIAE